MVTLPSSLVTLNDPLFKQKSLAVSIKRDDLIHPEVSGNKWRKLKYNLEEARSGNYEGLVTFGGAFSNHIAATAAACRVNGIPAIGIIRGDELTPESNHTLRKATDDGMQLRFVSREEYSLMCKETDFLASSYPRHFIVPEGGTNEYAIKGVREIWEELDQRYDYFLCPYGTGGTLAGLLSGNRKGTIMLGFSSLKGSFATPALTDLLDRFAIHNRSFRMVDDYHFGGYGKVTRELLSFISWFEETHQIPLDPIYTGKMMYGFYELVKRAYFPENSRILVLHTGGLQGKDAFEQIHSKKIR